jgi:hypothetical protein
LGGGRIGRAKELGREESKRCKDAPREHGLAASPNPGETLTMRRRLVLSIAVVGAGALLLYIGCVGGDGNPNIVVIDAAGGGGDDATTSSDGGAPASDGGTDAGTSPMDAGKDATQGTTCPLPYDASVVEQQWKTPIVNKSACSAGDVNNVNSILMSGGDALANVYSSAVVSAACRGCLFSNYSDSHWQLFVWNGLDAGAGGNAVFNSGSCYAASDGGTPACGKSVTDDVMCVELACFGACNNTTCQTNAPSTTCAPYGDATVTTCGGALDGLNMACNGTDFAPLIKAICGP